MKMERILRAKEVGRMTKHFILAFSTRWTRWQIYPMFIGLCAAIVSLWLLGQVVC